MNLLKTHTNCLMLHVAACALALTPVAAGAQAQTAPRWIEVAENVFAVLRPEPLRFNDSNSLVVVWQDGALVVDAQADLAYVRAIIDEIERRFAVPVRMVVNTHWHGDHTQGNQVYREIFGEQVEFVAHESVGADMLERAKPQLEDDMRQLSEAIAAAETQAERGLTEDGAAMSDEEEKDLRQRIDRAHTRLRSGTEQEWVLPTRRVGKREMLVVGERAIELLPFRAHTRGDLVVFLPEERIVVTGDVLDDLPYGGHGYPSDWIATLRHLETLDFDTIVPGHGGMRRGKKHLRLVLEMFEEIVAQTAEAVRAGMSLEEAKAATNLERFRTALVTDAASERAFDAFLPDTIQRAYLEAKGELPENR